MRILVTGASGFIGSGLVATLGELGHDVCALMRPKASNEFLKKIPFTRLSGDILDQPSLEKACQNTDAVIHLAGVTSAKNREAFFKMNAEGTKNIAHAALKSGTVKKFIYVSSLAAAGPSVGLSPKIETDSDHPVSMYGESKLRGELYLEELKGKLPYVIVRPPIVYGPRDRNFFLFFKSIQKQFLPILPAKTITGHKYYSAIHVDDLIQALICCLSAPEDFYKNGERFLVSDGQIYTDERMMNSIADAMKLKPFRLKLPSPAVSMAALAGTLAGNLFNKNMPFNLDKLKEVAPDYWICSSQKANDQLNFKPKFIMESGIPETLAWYKINGWL